MPSIPLFLNRRELSLHKAIVRPSFGVPTVLTNSPWTFVSLWLKRNKQENALFFWDQAQQFHLASTGLPLQSAPLLLYYSYMNATKALLASKGIAFDPRHGVRGVPRNSRRISLANEQVRINQNGIVPALSTYFTETEPQLTHTLKELLFNLVFVHRTYCLTYRSQAEMFIPLREAKYFFDKDTSQVFCQALLAKDALRRNVRQSLPQTLEWVETDDGPALRSRARINWSNPRKANDAELNRLRALHHSLRADFHYISGNQTLWYVKLVTRGPRMLLRRSPTITLAAMHRLSEICRYRPIELSSYLEGEQNWLLTEFIRMSPTQFLDEIASELTGHQFMNPNVRTPI